jgi:hypothetical protein
MTLPIPARSAVRLRPVRGLAVFPEARRWDGMQQPSPSKGRRISQAAAKRRRGPPGGRSAPKLFELHWNGCFLRERVGVGNAVGEMLAAAPSWETRLSVKERL